MHLLKESDSIGGGIYSVGDNRSSILSRDSILDRKSVDSKKPRSSIGNDIDTEKEVKKTYSALYLAYKQIRSTLSSDSGLVGLQNLGNTCYMNSALQCLLHCPPIIDIFLFQDFSIDKNDTNPLGSKGRVLEEFSFLIRKIWRERSNTLAPKALKHELGIINPLYRGYQQQDAQEVLLSLLDLLHEDLNRIKAKKYIPDPDLNSKTFSLANLSGFSQEAWNRYLARNDSHIQTRLHGQFASKITCRHCLDYSIRFDPFVILSLSLPSSSSSARSSLESELSGKKDRKTLSIEDCIEAFQKKEELEETEKWYCGNCKIHQNVWKEMSICRTPDTLILHLKRFKGMERQWGEYKKDERLVTFNTQTPILIHTTHKTNPTPYRVIAVLNHLGASLNFGHYIAHCRHPVNRKWHTYDDSSVREIDERHINSENNYLLFLEKCDVSRMGKGNTDLSTTPTTVATNGTYEGRESEINNVREGQLAPKISKHPSLLTHQTQQTNIPHSSSSSLQEMKALAGISAENILMTRNSLSSANNVYQTNIPMKKKSGNAPEEGKMSASLQRRMESVDNNASISAGRIVRLHENRTSRFPISPSLSSDTSPSATIPTSPSHVSTSELSATLSPSLSPLGETPHVASPSPFSRTSYLSHISSTSKTGVTKTAKNTQAPSRN